MFRLFKRKEKFLVTHTDWFIPNSTVLASETQLANAIRTQEYWKRKTEIVLGRNDRSIYLDFQNNPHLLIAGTTGSGKSVCINNILCNLLIKNSPKTLQLYIIDPKMVDFIKYKNLPHVKEYADTLNDAISVSYAVKNEMLNRYAEMQKAEITHVSELPDQKAEIYLVFDEFASFGKNKELLENINDIARLGRASGIHLIIGTQRPDRTVISSQLKANCPTRICFKTLSVYDDNIMDTKGAHFLHGFGDGLYLDASGDLKRFQGIMINKPDTERIIDYWKSERCKEETKTIMYK